jgi:TRAP-type C4-dicarboxylate transport system permease large subunit
MTFMVAIGQFTPPVAVNLMVASRLAGVRIEQTIPWVLWLVFAMGVVLAALIAIPELALWLPRSLGY